MKAETQGASSAIILQELVKEFEISLPTVHPVFISKDLGGNTVV